MIKQTMTNDELLNLSNTLNNLVRKGKGSAKLKYAVIRNIKFIADGVDTLNEMRKPTDDFEAYRKAAVDLANENCEKHDDGSLVLYIDKTYGTLAAPDSRTGVPKPVKGKATAYKKALDKLEKDNEKVVEAYNDKLKEFNEVLKTDVEVELYGIKLEWLEDIGIDYMEMNALEPAIVE